ncbi:unnamed protein product, partial [Meganyctiphanes norvegica]
MSVLCNFRATSAFASSFKALVTPVISYTRASSTSLMPGREEAVVLATDGTVVCWHPEPKFPYEYSKPLPEIAESESVLKVNVDDKTLEGVFTTKHPFYVNKELRELTYTTKHKWFPQ